MARSVDDYVQGLTGWQREAVVRLRAIVRAASPSLTEAFKWAQPVYESNGPVCYIKAHKHHVTFGFWRGAELMPMSKRLETSGSKMAHIKIASADDIEPGEVARLIQAAVELNASKGNPATGR
jgi:hypothetical protein